MQNELIEAQGKDNKVVPEFVPEYKKELVNKVNYYFDQLLTEPKGLKHFWSVLKLGNSYEEEIIQYNS